MSEIGVGMVGYRFMGKAHSNAYFTVSKFFDLEAVPAMRCIAGRSLEGARQAAARFGWQEATDSWEEMVRRDDVQLVDISAPSIAHRDVAVAAAKAALNADIVVVAQGPGNVGTATEFGHGGVEVGVAANAVLSLGGEPIIALRISFADPRPRHKGISHHSITALSRIALSPVTVPLPILEGEDMDIWQPITCSQFEALITDSTRRIEACLLDTLTRSGLATDEIDAVVRTGGSAQIPRFIEMMERIFGPEKVVLSDVFSSVTSGLAIRARE